MSVTVREKIKGSGQWWVFLIHKKKRKAKLVGDKLAALSLARELKKQIAEGYFNISKKAIPTFREYAEKWLRGYGESSLKYSTMINYRCLFDKHIFPIFGEKKLDTITRLEVKEFIFQKAKEVSLKTTRNTINLMSGIFSSALEDSILRENPAARTGKIMPKHNEKAKTDSLTFEEARVFLEAVEKHYPGYYEFFLTALRAGLRLGELLALKWSDIDFHGHFIEVKRNLVRGQVTTPKNYEMGRVDMSDQLTEALRALRTKRKAETLRRGWKEVPEWVFVNTVGDPLNGDNLRRLIFRKALEKAGLRQIRIHDLRHTCASLLLQAGASLFYVKNHMRHKSIKITVDTYGHLVPGANRDEINKLDDMQNLVAPGVQKIP